MAADDPVADLRVPAHDLPLLRVQLAGFQQHPVWDADLADVVHGRGLQQGFRIRFRKAELQGEDLAGMAHAHDVHAGLVVLVFSRPAQALDDLQASLLELLGAILDRGLQGPVLVMEGQVGLHPGPDPGRADGLGDVVHAAQVEALLLVLRGLLGGDEQHRDGAGEGVRLEPPDHFVAVHSGHHDVEQDQVRRIVLGGDLQRPDTAGSHFHPVGGGQDPPQDIDVSRGVIHDQDGGGRWHRFGQARLRRMDPS